MTTIDLDRIDGRLHSLQSAEGHEPAQHSNLFADTVPFYTLATRKGVPLKRRVPCF